MSAPPPESGTEVGADAPPPAKRRVRWGVALAIVVAGLIVLLLGLVGGARLAIRTDGGRRMLAHVLEGLPLGPVGRLHVEGIAGDPLGDLKLARLAVVDAKGVWLDARDVELRWRYAELFHRRFHAQAITARIVTLLRDPVVKAQAPSKGAAKLPIAVQVDVLRLRLESRPAFSVRRGLYDLDGGFALERNMAAQGRLAARSLLHAGDGLSADFQVGQAGRVQIRADAAEGPGGALAGALGLAVDRPLQVRMRAAGTVDAGSLSLRTASGAQTPLTADAAWGSGGARVTAALALGASRLTRDLAGRAGPMARLALAARHLHGDTFAVQGQLASDTATVAIDGPLDWKVRTTSGLKLDVRVSDARRWAPGTPIGAARLAGAVTGDPERFDFKGELAADRVGPEAGYTLARAQGPVSLSRRKDDWEVQADLRGAGGAGRGMVPGLLGPAPAVKLAIAHLPDGRWLVRSLDARGAGASVAGQGGQGLLGGLNFKGSARLASLGALRPGARGALDVAWTADRAKDATSPWRFSLDAHSKGFASGVAAADHLLGSAPSLKAQASWGAGGLEIADAALAGSAAQVHAKGRLDPKGPVGLDLVWSAQGPFEAGPLRIAGQAKGTGRIGGQLAAPSIQVDSEVASLALGKLVVAPARLDLTLTKVADALEGQVSVSGPSAYGPASLKAGYHVAGDRIEVQGLDADAGGVRAAGSFALAGGAPAAADLTVQLRPGAFLAAGRLDAALRLSRPGSSLTTHLAVDGQGVALPGSPTVLRRVQLHADGPLEHLPLQVALDGAGETPFSFSGSGRLDQVASARQLTLQGGGKVRRIAFRTLGPATLRLDGDVRQLSLAAALGGGRIDVSARQAGEAVSGTAKLAGVDLTTLNPDYTGAVNATLNLNGKASALGGVLDATLSGARSRDAPVSLALAGRVHATLAADRLRLSANATNAQGLTSSLDVDLPAAASAEPFRIAVDRTRPMRGQFSADGELRPLWDLLVGGDQRLSGRVSTAGQLAGSLNAPKLTGHAAIANGRYQNYAIGLDLQAFTVKADFAQDAVKVEQVSGTDGRGGSLAGSGDIGLDKGGASSFLMRLHRFRVIDNDTASAIMSGDATVTRDARGQAKLVGALTVDRADIAPNTPTPTGVVNMDVIEINKPGQENPAPNQAAPKSAVAPPVLLDVKVRAPRGVFVKGKGLNVELSLDAHVTGSASAPDLSGEARVVLGSYDFAGKRFDFDGRSVIRLGSTPETIRLDLTASRQNDASSTAQAATKPTSATAETTSNATPSANATLSAEVHVTGTAARPVITLTSTPVLPQDEVLSQVLFGSSAAQLTAAQAAELASTLASLSGGGGFDVLGRLRQFAGLDRLAFGQGASGTGVSGGKYVSDSVYIELTGGGREGPSAAVEWRVRPNFSVVSRVGTQGDAQLSIQYNKTFH